MARLIRMDRTGHTTVAEWTAEDPAAVERAVVAFREQLDRGYLAAARAAAARARPRRHDLRFFTRTLSPAWTLWPTRTTRSWPAVECRSPPGGPPC